MSPSERLRQKIQWTRKPLNDVLRRLWSHPRLAELLPCFFTEIHAVIRASVPLMEAALGRSRELAAAGTDPLASGLVDYFSHHIPEEQKHDTWLLEDLEVLGVPRAETLGHLPSVTLAQVVGAQYYWIHHVHPVALLGYIAVLEGNPPRLDRIEEVIGRTGLPREGFRTYIKHAHLDPHHKEDLDRAIDALPLADQHHTLMGVSALSTVQVLAKARREMLARFEGASATSAPVAVPLSG